MSMNFGRFARALLLTGGIATVIALPALVGTPIMPSNDGPSARVALAAPMLQDDDDDDGNDDPTNDNSDERNIEGQVIELNENSSPPEARVGMVGGDVWARLYNNQLHNSGVGVGDYVHMQGEYGDHGIFDAYQVNVIDRWDGDNGNDND
jgi:hypothetical protein